jgi:hypothetical protein
MGDVELYNRNTIKPVKTVQHEQFVAEIFDLGNNHQHSLETNVAAAQIGSTSWLPLSRELAHVCTVVVAKITEDFGCSYNSIGEAVYQTKNGAVRLLEWQLCQKYDFVPPVRNNFLSLVGKLIMPDINETCRPLGKDFFDISFTVCLQSNLLCLDQRAVLLGIVMLYRKGKLRSDRIRKERLFTTLLYNLAIQYDLSIDSVIAAYIKHKSSQ